MASNSIHRLAYFTVQVFTANLLGGILVFLQPVLVLNMAGGYALGVFSLLISWANIGAILASFGLLTAFQRLGARYTARQPELEFEVYRFFNRKAKLHLFVTAIGLALTAIVFHGDDVPLIIYPAIILVQVSIFFSRWFIVLARIREDNFWPNVFDQPVREGAFIVCMFVFMYLLYDGGAANGKAQSATILLILIYTLSAMAAAWLAKVYSSSKGLVPTQFKSNFRAHPDFLLRNYLERIQVVWLGIARTSAPSELGIYLIKRIDVVIVGMFVSTESAGIYFLMSRLAEVPNLIAGAMNVIVGPEFAKIRGSSDTKRRRMLYLAASILPTIVTMIVIGIVWGLNQAGLLDWLFGKQLDLLVLYIFLFGYILYFALGPSTTLLTMTGNQKISALVTCWVVPIHLMLVSLLTVWFGLIGAATAFCFSISLQKIAELTLSVKLKRYRNRYE